MGKILICVFLSSFSALGLEITLTRIFSISLWYHFAFMIISIAMLGIGASGTLLAVLPGLKKQSNLSVYGIFLGISIAGCYLTSNIIPFDPAKIAWDSNQLYYVSLYYLTLSIPFFFTGLIIGTAFSNMSLKSGLIYSSDLSGAGIGSVIILFLMYFSAPEKIVFLLSTTAIIGAFVIGGKRIRLLSGILIALNVLIIMQNPEFIRPRMSAYKGLQIALKFPDAKHINTFNSPFSRIDIFKSPAVRFAPGLSLTYLEPLPEQTGISIDGSEINAITNARDKKALGFLKHLPSAIPYAIGNNDDVLIIDSKGGQQALIAEYYKSKNIIKTESNPLLVSVIKDNFNELSGNLYEANTFKEMGRTWLRANQKKFDIIDISLMSAMPSGLFGISEDYRFTVEALKEYMNNLKPDGLLSINLFILPPPRIELRLLTTITRAMEEMGIQNIQNRIAAIRSWGTINIIVKNGEFSDANISDIKAFSRKNRFDLIYHSMVKEDETNIYVKIPSNEYFTSFKNIIDRESREKFIDDYIFDIRPAYDIKPFFNYFLRIENIKAIYEIMGRKWQYFIEEGYLLPAVFFQVLILSIVIILIPVPLFLKVKLKLNILTYFALLGLGFMFIEIALIHKMMLPLGNPAYAVATVLTSILMSSAIGSLLSQKFDMFRRPFILLFVSLAGIVFSFVLPYITAQLSYYGLYQRILISFFMFFPLGIFMGIPFPLGLRTLGEKESSLIPWAWAINGCFSVLGPILTIMLAMQIGFQAVLWIGGGMYIIAFITLKTYMRKFSGA